MGCRSGWPYRLDYPNNSVAKVDSIIIQEQYASEVSMGGAEFRNLERGIFSRDIYTAFVHPNASQVFSIIDKTAAKVRYSIVTHAKPNKMT